MTIHASRLLPDILRLPALPHTANGKIGKKRLAATVPPRPHREETPS